MHKLWIDLDDNLIPVAENQPYEEWSNQQGHALEDLLDSRMCRRLTS